MVKKKSTPPATPPAKVPTILIGQPYAFAGGGDVVPAWVVLALDRELALAFLYARDEYLAFMARFAAGRVYGAEFWDGIALFYDSQIGGEIPGERSWAVWDWPLDALGEPLPMETQTRLVQEDSMRWTAARKHSGHYCGSPGLSWDEIERIAMGQPTSYRPFVLETLEAEVEVQIDEES